VQISTTLLFISNTLLYSPFQYLQVDIRQTHHEKILLSAMADNHSERFNINSRANTKIEK